MRDTLWARADDATDSLVLNFGLAPPSDPRAPQID